MNLQLSPAKTNGNREVPASVKKLVGTVSIVSGLFLLSSCGGGSSSGDIETWLVEVGNDFPDEAKCVAGEMGGYSVSDFEASFDGERNESFESDLDAAYDKCDGALDITDGS